MRNRPPRHPAGFTLIEMLVAVSLSALIAAAVYHAMSQGTAVFRLSEKHYVQNAEFRGTVDTLFRDFEGSYYIGYRPATSWNGDRDSVEFCTAYPVLSRVKIFFDRSENRLLYFKRPVGAEIKDEEGIPLLRKTESFELSYYDSEKETWQSGWDTKDKGKLPGVVRVQIGILQGESDIKVLDYCIQVSYEAIRKKEVVAAEPGAAFGKKQKGNE